MYKYKKYKQTQMFAYKDKIKMTQFVKKKTKNGQQRPT